MVSTCNTNIYELSYSKMCTSYLEAKNKSNEKNYHYKKNLNILYQNEDKYWRGINSTSSSLSFYPILQELSIESLFFLKNVCSLTAALCVYNLSNASCRVMKIFMHKTLQLSDYIFKKQLFHLHLSNPILS